MSYIISKSLSILPYRFRKSIREQNDILYLTNIALAIGTSDFAIVCVIIYVNALTDNESYCFVLIHIHSASLGGTTSVCGLLWNKLEEV